METVSLPIVPTEPTVRTVLSVIANSEEKWNNLIEGAELRWQCPKCFDAADRKHIEINHLKNSGSEYCKFKDFNSVYIC